MLRMSHRKRDTNHYLKIGMSVVAYECELCDPSMIDDAVRGGGSCDFFFSILSCFGATPMVPRTAFV